MSQKTKQCTKCNSNKKLSEFRKDASKKDGFYSSCKDCQNIVRKRHYIKNKKKINQQCADYYKKNKDNIKKSVKNWKCKNPEKVNATNAKRRYIKITATPNSLSKENLTKIKKIYKEAKELEMKDGIKRHVDHIMPLIHKNFCGLHVPWNLQILTKEENLKKSNKVDYEF